MITAVVFDFDGVLADTERLHLSAYQDAFAPHGWSLDEDEYFSRYYGYDDARLVDAFAGDRGLELRHEDKSSLLERKFAAFRRHVAAGSVLYPGAAACVARLGARFKLAIASGAFRSEIVDILEGGGLLGAFGVIVGADDVARTKPAPDPYLEAAARLGVDPRHCVAIEDSRWGLESAIAAGMQAIGITTTSPAAGLSTADHLIAALDEVTVDLIDRLAARRRA